MSNPFKETLSHMRAIAEKRRARATTAFQATTAGAQAADAVATWVGSWRFVIIQSGLLVAWIVFNVISSHRVDPYPFVLLNLLLSFQAAYTAPIIMMSQNRQGEIDRKRAIDDFDINCKAEIEIETLHAKIDALREQEIAQLTAAVDRLTRMLEAKS
ncbi:MAG: DUF1003 domain-containing protein [Proteobacteria bacterium]|nr:DUF1003 domain-containing protein [Pseudomonadota bacterium]